MTSRENIHLWFPNTFEFKGGIQTYSAFLLKALEELYPQTHLQVLLKHDRRKPPSAEFLSTTKFSFSGSWPAPIRTPAFALSLLLNGLTRQPDLIISSHLNFSPIGYLLHYLAKTPFWVIAHGVEAWKIDNRLTQTALTKAEKILCVSKYTKVRLQQSQRLDPQKLPILSNTFDESRFVIKPKPKYLLERLGLEESQPVILTVSRLDSTEKYKGYDKVISALPEILKGSKNVKYILVGSGDDTPRVKEQISKLQLDSQVILTGYVSDSELSDFYNLCDIFIMPSKGEGFGIVYLEALGCGKPVIAGNQDGAVDALNYGELGVLINPDSSQEIASSITQILTGNYQHPLIYNPNLLRERTIALFGFEKFKQTLKLLLTEESSR